MLDLDALFSPRGIAIVGASADATRIGGQPIKALLDSGYEGSIYPVNPRYEQVLTLRCLPSVENIDGPCDLAIIAVRAPLVEEIIISCGRQKIKYAIILSGGFSEASSEGRGLQARLLSVAKDSKVRIIGPNCQGLISVPNRVFAAFGAISRDIELKAGNVSMTFQSGGFGFSIVTLCDQLGLGFRHCISTGNEADITTPELLDTLLDDSQTNVVCTYVEGVRDGRALMAVGAKSLRVGKPILIWKGGKTDSGARAAASHTASMTGSYDIFRAVARQAGLIEVDSVEEMADLIRVFAANVLPGGHGVGVMGISGGSGIVFADKAVECGLSLPELNPDTVKALQQVLPSFGSSANPVDITAGIFNDISAFKSAIKILLSDPDIHQLCILLASLPGKLAKHAAQTIAAASKQFNKPISVAWSARREKASSAYEILEDARIPIIPSPVRLARAASWLATFAEDRDNLKRQEQTSHATPPADAFGLLKGINRPNEHDAKALLGAYGIVTTPEYIVHPGDSLGPVLAALHPPLAVKILSSDIAHKTDIGGVELNIRTQEELADSINRVISNALDAHPRANIQGVLVSEMVTDGTEALVGIVNDDIFGPIVAFGLGGIFAEILRDIAYRAAPFDYTVAMQLINELRGRALFNGARGFPTRDVKRLAKTLVSLSELAYDLRDAVQELDINPLFVGTSDCIAADALLVLKDRSGERPSQEFEQRDSP